MKTTSRKNQPDSQPTPSPDMGMSNMFGNMMGGGMMGGMPPFQQPEPPVEENVIDGEYKEVSPEPVESDDTATNEMIITDEVVEDQTANHITMKTSSLMTIYRKEDSTIATVYFLCKDINDKLFVLAKNYQAETREDIKSLDNIVGSESELWYNNKLTHRMIMNTLNCYNTDFDFGEQSDFKTNFDPYISITASKSDTNEEYNISMPSEQFACIAYIDNYIIAGKNNEHDFNIACSGMFSESIPPAQFAVVENIESIVYMTEAVKVSKFKKIGSKESLAVVMKVSYFIGNERQVNYILTPWYTDKKYNKSKFKGKTIKDIENDFYKDADQYNANLKVDELRLNNIDKEYMMLHGVNKEGQVKIFLLDSSVKEELINKIEVF